MTKTAKTLISLGAGLLAACIICCTLLSAFTLLKVRAIDSSVSGGDTPEATAENDVTIAGSYVIRATTQISDAYISGDSSSLSDRDKETLATASSILKSIVTDDMTLYEKELAVYEWMCENLAHDNGMLVVIPTTQADADNPYGVLKYHNAVCVGYATTFRLFMQMLGIECKVVHNTEAYHSWDLVKLDGEWYHTDVYSDVGTTTHACFNENDQMRLAQQTWDQSYFPAATGLKYCYNYQNADSVSDIYAIPAKIKSAMDEGKSTLTLRVENLGSVNSVVFSRLMEDISNAVYSQSSDGNVSFGYEWCVPTLGTGLLSLRLRDDSSSAAVSEEDAKKIYDAVSGSFGEYTPSDGGIWTGCDE